MGKQENDLMGKILGIGGTNNVQARSQIFHVKTC